jgi:hypothetical protein
VQREQRISINALGAILEGVVTALIVSAAPGAENKG